MAHYLTFYFILFYNLDTKLPPLVLNNYNLILSAYQIK